MTATESRTEMAMGTLVTIRVPEQSCETEVPIDRAFGWFREIEDRCTRFDARSELSRLSTRIGEAVAVSAILFEAVQFAVKVAEESGGAFDPTVGGRMRMRGYDKNYRTGASIKGGCDGAASYRDLKLDPERKTITLLRPLTLDLGAVAKGLAVDLAAAELEPFGDFGIDAGGDLYVGGTKTIGIRHPRSEGLIATLQVSDAAVCTSGDYERPGHILDPRNDDPRGTSLPNQVASVTVAASTAMLADALATAAFVLGPDQGIELLLRMGVNGLIVTHSLQTGELNHHQTGDLFHVA